MLTPNGSGEGAGVCCNSSRKMYCCTAVQPVPPYSLGQCETAQPFLLRMRVHSTRSSLLVWRPSFSLSRIAEIGRASCRERVERLVGGVEVTARVEGHDIGWSER